MERIEYNDNVKDHFFNPRNVGAMADTERTGTEGTPGSGPFMQIYVKLCGDVITDISFKTYGCAASIASCSKLTEMVKGKPASEALNVTPDALLQVLGGLPLGKRHCPDMAVSALRKALKAEG